MDKTEVTNDQLALFLYAIGYVTTAEKNPDWNELKKELPPDTPKPDDSILRAGSLVFIPLKGPVKLNGYENRWKWEPEAIWKHPKGPNSPFEGKGDHLVVHISWYDA